MPSLSTASNPSGWYGIVIGLAALGWNVFNAILERRPKLLVRQIGDSITDRAHTRPDGRVIYMLRAVVVNESMKKPVVIAAYHLGLPWKDEYLDLLPDPKEIEKENYIVPGSQNSIWRYPREMILNHRVNSQGKLAPGEAIEGALLFNGMEPIPDDLPHGHEIEVDLRVLLQTGRPILTKCRMVVDKGHRTRGLVEPTGAELLTKR
jgi:hypothetical protein